MLFYTVTSMEMLSHSGPPPVFLLLTSGMPVLSLKKAVKEISAKEGGNLFPAAAEKQLVIGIIKLIWQTVCLFFLTKGLLLDFRDCSFAN